MRAIVTGGAGFIGSHVVDALVAQGAEVALLIRRLRQRLVIEADRLQVICTTASFHDHEYAPFFGAQLTGKHADDFRPIK